MAASKPSNSILVYNTKTGKEYPIHPTMAKDKVWMASRSLILVEKVRPFVATNMESSIPASIEATPVAEPVQKVKPNIKK